MKNIEYYKEKKIKFANTKQPSYYQNCRNWGEIYGYTLKPPYTLKEIEEYEKKYDVILPHILREYLFCISRENTKGYPCIISLNEPDDIYLDDSGYNEYYYDYEVDKSKFIKNLFIEIYDGGCTYQSYICIKGPWYGKIACNMQGGDYICIDNDETLEEMLL